MEHKIGEIFEFDGEWYQCVEGNDCANCVFIDYCKSHTKKERDDTIGLCVSFDRNDGMHVIFKKLEKVGEPFSCDYYGDSPIMMQEYNLYNLDDVTNEDNIPMYITDYRHKRIAIGIKQKQEDMEEKELVEKLSEKVHNAWMEEKKAQGFTYGEKYDYVNKKHPVMLPYKELSEEVKEYDRVMVRAVLKAQQELRQDSDTKLNLKPFDLEAAKAGKPVCTSDGRKARIICFDKKYIRPIVALVDHWDEVDEEVEGIIECHNDGYYNCREIPSPNDLMMLPEKHEGWVNVYKIKESTFGYITSYFDTEKNAKEDKEQLPGYVATVKINWSE